MEEPQQTSGVALRDEATRLAVPRYPGTAGDDEVIERVATALEQAGCEVRRQEFDYDLTPVWRLLRVMLATAALALAVATGLLESRPLAAIVVLAVAVGGGISLLGWFPWLERLYRRPGSTVTSNVEGVVPAAGRPLILLMAHHDSKSQNLTMLERGMLTVVALLSVLGVLVLAIGVLAGAVAAPAAWARWLVGGTGVVALVLLSTLRSGNESPGGVDNAGSLAVLLALAQRLPARIGDRAELRFLSTGAEEDHMIGAMRYLDRHFPDGPGERPVYVLNLDGAGAPGRIVLLERYGFGYWFSKELSELARREAEALGLRPRGVLLPPGMGIDAIPFAHRGLPCLTLSSGSLGRATLAVHSAADRAENLDPETLEAVYRLTERMAERLAEGETDALSRAPLRAES